MYIYKAIVPYPASFTIKAGFLIIHKGNNKGITIQAYLK